MPSDLAGDDKAFVHRIGNALRKKMQHRDAHQLAYWEQPHVAAVPFVIAVGAFHNDHTHWQPMSLVAEYVYGQRTVLEHSPAGTVIPAIEDIETHESLGKQIPSGLFNLAGSENLAGVLFSNAHGTGKFNRIGIEHGYASPAVTVVRTGICYDLERPARPGGRR